MNGLTGFRGMSPTSWGCVKFRCRLLVIMRSLRLVVLVFEGCLELHGGVLLFIVAACYCATVMSGHTGFRRMSRTSRWCVTLNCRLLVIVQSLQLVIPVFEECLKLTRGVLLFNVGCLLLCNRYDWSYRFSKNVSNLCRVCYSLM